MDNAVKHVKHWWPLWITLVALNGCSRVDEAKWQEEVLLHDGRLIVIERRAARAKSSFPDHGRGNLLANELVYAPGNVRWGFDDKSAGRTVLTFDIFDGVPHMVIEPGRLVPCAKKLPAAYDADFLKWQNDRWVDVGQDRFPLGSVTQNVSTRYWGRTAENDAQGLLRWQDKISNDYLQIGNDYRDTGKPDLLTDWLDKKSLTCAITYYKHSQKD